MIIDKSILVKANFTCRENDAFIGEMQVDENIKMYGADRFNYVFEAESISQLEQQNEIIDIGSFPDYEAIATV
jgi:hypothetical protein